MISSGVVKFLVAVTIATLLGTGFALLVGAAVNAVPA